MGGACPLTTENVFLKEYYKDLESILFYKPLKYEAIDAKIEPFLNYEALRQAVVKKGLDITLISH